MTLFNLNPARISKSEKSIPKTLNKVNPVTVEELYSVFVLALVLITVLVDLVVLYTVTVLVLVLYSVVVDLFVATTVVVLVLVLNTVTVD